MSMTCVSIMLILFTDKVEVPHCVVGSVFDGSAWVGWWMSGNWFGTKPSSALSDSPNAFVFSFLGHLTYARLLKLGASSHFRVCDLSFCVAVKGSGGHQLSKRGNLINRKWETGGSHVGQFLLFLFPKMRFLLATPLENSHVLDGHFCDLLYQSVDRGEAGAISSQTTFLCLTFFPPPLLFSGRAPHVMF